MEINSIEREILGLSNEEAVALFYAKCLNHSAATIANASNPYREPDNPIPKTVLAMSESTVNNRIREGLRFLKFPFNERSLPHEYCLVFRQLVESLGEPPDWSKWPPEVEVPLPSEEKPAVVPLSTSEEPADHAPVPPSDEPEEEPPLDDKPEATGASSEQESDGTHPVVRTNPIQNIVSAIRGFVSRFGLAGLGILIVLILLLVFGGFLLGRFILTGITPLETPISSTPVQEESSETATNGQPGDSLDSIAAITSVGAETQEAINREIVEGTLTAVSLVQTRDFLSATPDATGTQIVIETAVSGTLAAIAAAETAKATPTQTLTSTPSNTPTITPTPTETPTSTPTPIILGVGETHADDRISVELVSAELGGRYGASKVTVVNAAVVFRFKFTNLLQDDVFNLHFIQSDFKLKDNMGREYFISKTDGGHTYANYPVDKVLGIAESHDFAVGYGRLGDFDNSVEYVIVTLHDFSSLGTVSWRMDIEN